MAKYNLRPYYSKTLTHLLQLRNNILDTKKYKQRNHLIGVAKLPVLLSISNISLKSSDGIE